MDVFNLFSVQIKKQLSVNINIELSLINKT
jgi:hypothetical protein